MRVHVVALLALVGCGDSIAVGVLVDSGSGSDVRLDVGSDAGGDAPVDTHPDSSADVFVADSAEAAAVCPLIPTPVAFGSYGYPTKCIMEPHPECMAPCEMDGGVAQYGITCTSGLANGVAPKGIQASSFLGLGRDSGVPEMILCATQNFCVPPGDNSGCTNPKAPYAWTCPLDWNTRNAYLSDGCVVGINCFCLDSTHGGGERCCTTDPSQ